MNKLLKFLEYLIPIIPLKKSFENVDRRFFVFIEQPLIGLFATPISLVLSEIFIGINIQFDLSFTRSVFEVYFAYQLAQLVRDGVNTDENIKNKYKVLLNWFYSVLSYSLFTAGDKLVFANTIDEKLFAYSLITFSFIWPIISQISTTYIWTPIMYHAFPKRTQLLKLFNNSINEVNFTIKYNAENYLEKLFIKKWINWFNKSNHNSNQLISKKIQYWLIKTVYASSAAIIMTSLYFTLRWLLVGINPNLNSPILLIWQKLLNV